MKKRVWIYCRVLSQTHLYLLKFQEKKLFSFAKREHMDIIGITKEVGSAQTFQRYPITQLLPYIKTNRIDMILVDNQKRLFSNDDLLYEFLLLCEYYHVRVIETKSS
ncbi:recombinase family protein [Candidatus Stoquefichus massiliensis]|uniref:recombinase family protein n=1 Tax=Candidatus Stoquefichus massiliensis TaxID=1470350 RepID=UPI0004853B46|nr:recombinase family protein [Candidatus Stoquefichus massiliensis]